MNTTSATPAGPAPVWDVINGFTSYWALSAALDLGLFDALAEHADSGKGLDAKQLAASIGATEDAPVTVLAETLVALDLLAAVGSRFRLTPVAEHYLVSSAPASMAALVRHSPGPPGAWPGLAETIRTGAPEPAVTADLTALYPALVRATGPTQARVASAVAAELERRGWWPRQPTVVDLGCGSGAWLTALLRTRPSGTVIAVDRPNVLPIAEQAAREVGLREHVITVAGDYLEADLPVAAADVVVLAHVLRAEPAERARRLLARAVELAGADGVVVVVDYTRPDPARTRHDDSGGEDHGDDGVGEDRGAVCVAARHELLLSLTMLASTAGLGVTVADLRAWAEAADAELVDSFEPVPRQHVRLIRSRTPEATS
ncbi:methyltransferase [Streptomyces sp. NPDC059460]|uniref:methyltransferase n=1 Tax=Streptomyces sp. NPDC059460 TaxID=3346840 RepID=UPI00369BC778